MTKKLKVANQQFSPAGKQARAEQREAERLQREKVLNGSILTPVNVRTMHETWGTVFSMVRLDGKTIAAVGAGEGRVQVHFPDTHCTTVEFRNVEACKELLTYRKVAIANMFPNGAFNLAQLVRQRDAEADAEQLRAACVTQSTEGNPPHQQKRL